MKIGNVLSLFDGISCGQVALQRAGIEYDNYYASEISVDSIKVTMYNHPNTIQLGDVNNLIELDDDGLVINIGAVLENLPKIDLLIGGSPCQGLSRAKSDRENLKDPRSRLFYNYVKIKEWLQKNNNPDLLFLLENVKPDKETKEIMTEKMGIEPLEINSELVSAQRRVRLYWTNIDVKELPKHKNLKIKDIIYDNNYKIFQDERIENTKEFKNNYIQWDMSGKGYKSQQDRAYYMEGTMCTIPKQQTESKTSIYLGEDKYRRSHPIEIERLQTLPDNYTSIIKSPNKRMGLIGDGWTVDVIAHIFSFIK